MNYDMLRYTFTRWTFMTFLTFFIFLLRFDASSSDGLSLVIGSPEQIVAVVGDDVILPCHLEPQANAEDLTVEWARLDLQPERFDSSSNSEYVHLYRDGEDIPDSQMASYIGRTDLLGGDELRRGNVSLKLTNVTLSDQGQYRCLLPRLKSPVKAAVIQLVVESNLTGTSTTATPLQTPEPTKEQDSKGDRSYRIGLILGATAFGILIAITSGILLKKKQNGSENHKPVVSVL
ncbi:hypothetical protein LDENG_00177970 [Lucifuga dentata]|nr:hypothetical protein LDENG_00177970 [Lucifuga dentata]